MFFLRFIVLLLVLSSCSYARTLKVGSNEIYKTIGSALSISLDGDTVIVAAGTYSEKNLVIRKSITLIGKNYPILDGSNKYEIISIRASFVTLTGFKIQHSGDATLEDPAGVKVYNVHHVSIINNILEDTFFGIYLQNVKHCIVKNNRLKAYGKMEQEIGNGIHCWKCDSLQIIGNQISGHRDGIYFEFVTNSIIWRNISKSNLRYGLHFMFSNNDAYIGNVFKTNGAGVAVMFTNNVKMYNNYFIENWGDAAYGILLKEISDSYVEGNVFDKNTMGVFMEGASRIVMTKNIFSSNGWAIKVQASCMDVKVKENNFFGNTFDVSTNGTLVLNQFNNNYWDKYEGYDLDKNGRGDIPFHPINLYSMIVEQNPPAMILFRSIIVNLLDQSEKMIPSLTPENLVDESPWMKALPL